MVGFFLNLVKIVSSAAVKVIVTASSERVLTKFAVKSVERLSKKTTNEIDDDFVSVFKEEVYKKFPAKKELK